MMFSRTGRPRRPVAVQEQIWPAPVLGLVRNNTLLNADPRAAEVLDNFFCTTTGARMRGGSSKRATIASGVKSLLVYRSGSAEELFAADDTTITDVTSVADPDVAPTADVSGLTSGDWSSVQFANSGGQYLYITNGADSARHYNGTTWATPTITGVTSSDLSFVWSHKKRLWFVEQNTLSAWYLATDAISGAATEFPLDGVFRLGGHLLFGGTWSLDSGDGLDDNMVFVTSEGEIAIYTGTDPSSASTWALTGVYRMGKPLNKNAWFRAGGDLLILTEEGIVNVSQAVQRDFSTLYGSAITTPIDDLWREHVANRSSAFPMSATRWPDEALTIIGAPRPGGGSVGLVVNNLTGAWSRVTGWDIQCATVFDGGFYFGTSDGTIIQGDTGGQDQGAVYSAHYLPKFQEFGSPADKLALHCRPMWRGQATNIVKVRVFSNYQVGDYAVSEASQEELDNIWGTGIWGQSTWGNPENPSTGLSWQTVTGSGLSLSAAWSVTSGRTTPPGLEIIATQLRYELASPL